MPNINAAAPDLGSAKLTSSTSNISSGNIGPAMMSSISGAPSGDVINPLSYAALIKDFNRFRAAARSQSDMHDMPGHVFFRVVFHFTNGSDAQESVPGIEGRDVVAGNENAWSGLIAPSWLDFGSDFNGTGVRSTLDYLDKLWRSSTAFNYFVLNKDLTRARYTKQFIELLSNISSECPWYFQNIKGLETAIERAIANQGSEFEIKDERNKISIECLEDSYDQRIGTLLDLYRSIVWSWETKRVMLPANLRKFDMTIIAFQMPLRGRHVSRNSLNIKDISSELVSSEAAGRKIERVVRGPNGSTAIYTSDSMEPVASFKAWEFHGCEIDYNSSKSAWSELDNAAGSIPKYTIDIMYDDVFETRFNEFMEDGAGETITDVVGDDTAYIYDEELSPLNIDIEEYDTYAPKYVEPNNGLLDQVVGAGASWVDTKLKKIYLGNINGLSISKVGQQINQALDGDLWGTVANISNYTRGNYNGSKSGTGSNIFPDPQPSISKQLGNIFKTNTLLNS